ncbi:hypothetical protein [Chitinophaga sp. sic0106]|uniref:hypothetical protein n=1 Tax=Chitinophaga sp. sic0106 TaxID=2854785 RepID=UPI001C46B4D6|nr:hypothetical protein [Chitinophaga sp. sic0106]MBV7530459.1 hypothetical protein [Chitinophaga sp. sic0106]
MANYTTEIRSTFGTKYVKVFLKDKSRLEEIRVVLSNLTSVKNINVTQNKEPDLTAYPSKVYTAEETQQEIEAALKVIFESKPADPVVIEEGISSISELAYRQIIDLIYYFGKNMEKLTNLRSKFDEEGYREYFLPYLNSMSPNHTATGETFNKIGKTDILVQNTKSENVFIAECKLWGGESQVHPAIDQLLQRYVTWRDEKLAFIIFNKTVKGFSEIVNKAIEAIKSHPLCKRYLGQTKDSCASFIFVHPEDPKKEVQLELIMFDCA